MQLDLRGLSCRRYTVDRMLEPKGRMIVALHAPEEPYYGQERDKREHGFEPEDRHFGGVMKVK